MADRPAVTVLMSAFNNAPYLRASIDSILNQSLGDIELLITDDGSTDETWDILQGLTDPRLRIWRRENAGKPAALNTMLPEARGEFVAIQDADDLSCADRLEKLVAAMAAQPGLGAVFSGHSLIIGDRIVAPRGYAKSTAECAEDIRLIRPPAHDPTIMCRTEIAQRIGFDPALRQGEGFDFILQLGETHPLAVIPEPLYQYRVHVTSATLSNVEARAHYVRQVIEKARARRGMPALGDDEFEATYGRGLRDRWNNLSGHFVESVYSQRMLGDWWGAFRTAFQSTRIEPFRMNFYKSFAYVLAPAWVIERYRGRRKI